MTTTDKLAAFDAAIAAELPRVYHLEYDSHEICKHFAGKVRERLLAAHDAEQAQEPVPGVIWGYYGEDGASLVQRGKEDEMIGRNGGRRLYLAPVEQAAKAVPALYVGLIERLMRLSTRLGIAYEGGVEHFAASLEDRLYAICRGAESLLNSVATPPAPEAPPYRMTAGEVDAMNRALTRSVRFVDEAQAAPEAQQPAGQELPPLPPIDDYLPTDGPRWTTANFIACVERNATDYARAALAQRRQPLTDEDWRTRDSSDTDEGCAALHRAHGIGATTGKEPGNV